jgi:hypothetical protein
MAPKTWLERFQDPKPYEVKPAPSTIAGMRAGQIMLVPIPGMIDSFIRRVPSGTCVDVKTMRQALAIQHGAEVTCPIYTGYHLRTVAEAAYEAYQQGVAITEITPFWRVIDARSLTARRLACGLDFLRMKQQQEGAPSLRQHAEASRQSVRSAGSRPYKSQGHRRA